MIKQKASHDDQRGLIKTFHPKDVLPSEIRKHIHPDSKKRPSFLAPRFAAADVKRWGWEVAGKR